MRLTLSGTPFVAEGTPDELAVWARGILSGPLALPGTVGPVVQDAEHVVVDVPTPTPAATAPRRRRKGRQGGTRTPLTADEVEKIWKLHDEGGLKPVAIAEKTGRSPPTVRKILRGRRPRGAGKARPKAAEAPELVAEDDPPAPEPVTAAPPEGWFPCDECERRFANQSALNRHKGHSHRRSAAPPPRASPTPDLEMESWLAKGEAAASTPPKPGVKYETLTDQDRVLEVLNAHFSGKPIFPLAKTYSTTLPVLWNTIRRAYELFDAPFNPAAPPNAMAKTSWQDELGPGTRLNLARRIAEGR